MKKKHKHTKIIAPNTEKKVISSRTREIIPIASLVAVFMIYFLTRRDQVNDQDKEKLENLNKQVNSLYEAFRLKHSLREPTKPADSVSKKLNYIRNQQARLHPKQYDTIKSSFQDLTDKAQHNLEQSNFDVSYNIEKSVHKNFAIAYSNQLLNNIRKDNPEIQDIYIAINRNKLDYPLVQTDSRENLAEQTQLAGRAVSENELNQLRMFSNLHDLNLPRFKKTAPTSTYTKNIAKEQGTHAPGSTVLAAKSINLNNSYFLPAPTRTHDDETTKEIDKKD